MMVTLPAVMTHDLAGGFVLSLCEAVRAEPGDVTADASQLQEFDSSALAVLLDCRRAATAAGKQFFVQGLPARLRQLAGLYGVAHLIPPSPSSPSNSP